VREVFEGFQNAGETEAYTHFEKLGTQMRPLPKSSQEAETLNLMLELLPEAEDGGSVS
jgi:hypothetical protein